MSEKAIIFTPENAEKVRDGRKTQGAAEQAAEMLNPLAIAKAVRDLARERGSKA